MADSSGRCEHVTHMWLFHILSFKNMYAVLLPLQPVTFCETCSTTATFKEFKCVQSSCSNKIHASLWLCPPLHCSLFDLCQSICLHLWALLRTLSSMYFVPTAVFEMSCSARLSDGCLTRFVRYIQSEAITNCMLTPMLPPVWKKSPFL